MANVPVDRVFRSLGTAAVLALNEYNPEEDFALLDAGMPTLPVIPRFDGRVGVTYAGQDHPFTYGPFGIYLIPGIVLEFDQISNRRNKCQCSVILSISRLLENKIELELRYLYELSARIRKLVFVDKSCPIYNFEPGIDDVSEKAGRIYWFDEVFKTVGPFEKLVADQQVGGWARLEYHFVINFTLDTGWL